MAVERHSYLECHPKGCKGKVGTALAFIAFIAVGFVIYVSPYQIMAWVCHLVTGTPAK